MAQKLPNCTTCTIIMLLLIFGPLAACWRYSRAPFLLHIILCTCGFLLGAQLLFAEYESWNGYDLDFDDVHNMFWCISTLCILSFTGLALAAFAVLSDTYITCDHERGHQLPFCLRCSPVLFPNISPATSTNQVPNFVSRTELMWSFFAAVFFCGRPCDKAQENEMDHEYVPRGSSRSARDLSARSGGGPGRLADNFGHIDSDQTLSYRKYGPLR